MPRMRRATSSIQICVAAALSSEPTANKAAMTMITGLRPNRSVRPPPIAAPATAPTSTMLVTTPCIVGDSANSFLMNSRAPEITPVS